MAITDVIKRLIWQFTSTGADKVAADMGQVNAEQTKLAVNTENTTKASLDLEASFNKLERRFDTTIRAQQDYEKVQRQVNAAVAQHPELQERANSTLAKAADYFDKARGATGAYSKAVEAARGAALGLAAGIGPLGAVLGSYGPLGVAAAVGIGLVVNAMTAMKEHANEIGDASASLKKFADSTGLTTTQVRGLTEAGAEVGASADDVGSALQKFTTNLDAARKGSGSLYTELQSIDKGLAEDIASSDDTASALDKLAKAYASTTDAVTKAAIARAAFGKGGVGLGGMLTEIADASGVNAYSDSVEKALGVTKEWTDKVAELRTQNKSLEESLKLIEAAWYTPQMLERQQQALKYQISMAEALAKTTPKDTAGTFGVGEGIAEPIPLKNVPVAANEQIVGGFGGMTDASNKATKSIEQLNDEFIRTAQTSAATASALGSFATAAEKAQAQIDALDVALNKGTIDPEQYARAADQIRRLAAEVEKVKAAHEGMSEPMALQLDMLEKQTTLARAVGAAEKMAAQYAIDYATAKLQGATAAEATAIASEKEAATQAATNAAAQETLFSLQNQAAAAAAVTGAQQMAAQAAATYSQMVRNGVDATIASAVAAQQLANAHDAATANVERQVKALDRSTELINAQTADLGTGGHYAEMMAAAGHAYDIAIESGASATAAAAISSATIANYMAKAAQEAERMAQAEYAARTQADLNAASKAAGGSPFGLGYESIAYNYSPSGGYTSTKDLGTSRDLLQMAQDQKVSIQDRVNAAYVTGGVAGALAAAQNAPNTIGNTGDFANLASQGYDLNKILGEQRSTASDKISAIDQIMQLQNAQTTDKGVQAGNIQAEIAMLSSLPASVDRDQKIADLRNSIDQLTKSTDSLNSTNQELLSPYYTQDPRTSHIGFRSQGMASGGYVDVPGSPSSNDNMIATVPVASGERIYIDPMNNRRSTGSGGGMVINISSPITINGSANADQFGRTLYQANQQLAKQVRAAAQ